MPKRHVGSFYQVLISNPADFLCYSSHYLIYLFCISQYGINKEKRCRKTQASRIIIDRRESGNIKKTLITMCPGEPFAKLTPLAPL